MRLLLLAMFGIVNALTAFGTEPAPKDAEDPTTVTVVGTLRTGLVAIGGETTGTTITAKDITWELDIGKNAELKAASEKLDRKLVTVSGTLERRAGVEIKERWIVTVKSLKAATGGMVEIAAKPPFHASVGRKDSRIRFEAEGDATILDITSEFGIDKASVTRLTDEWPKSIVVRLHLKGLESFKASNEDVTVEWAVGSDGDSRVTLWKGKEEIPLDRDSPYFTQGRVVGGDGKVPLKDGYFEVPLPAKLFEDKLKEVKLHWIDFYRN